MKKFLFMCAGTLVAVAAFAQEPTTNWPYLYPEFKEGELNVRSKTEKALFNIHLDLGALHYVEDGRIKEANILNATTLVIGNDVFRNVAGKMLKVLARAQGGYIVEETRATYSAVVRNDGAYGTTALNSTTTKTF